MYASSMCSRRGCCASSYPPQAPSLVARNVEWEGSDVWFAHCCMLDEQETQQFADKGIGIAHCPSSNLRLASGEPRQLQLTS